MSRPAAGESRYLGGRLATLGTSFRAPACTLAGPGDERHKLLIIFQRDGVSSIQLVECLGRQFSECSQLGFVRSRLLLQETQTSPHYLASVLVAALGDLDFDELVEMFGEIHVPRGHTS